jgi:hypothetical protein
VSVGSACQVDSLDEETRSVLSNLGEDGEALCQAFTSVRRNETSACACAMRLLRDRSSLSRSRTQMHDAALQQNAVGVAPSY